MDIRDSFLAFGTPLIGEEEIQEVEDCLRSGWLSTGPKVAEFEESLREYTNSQFAIALNSCTAGLHLSLLAAGIGKRDEVITTPMTFCATVNTIIHVGAKPVLVDIERDTQLIDTQRIEEAITPQTKGIVPVHLYGRPCKMDAITEIAEKYNLVVIEDAAHALESKYQNQKIGSISDFTCFSFYATKNICTGEGGLVTTDNPEFAKKIRICRLHGLSRDAWKRYSNSGYEHYQVLYPGFKYNMMDIQAAIGIHQLKHIDDWLERRNEIWNFYDQSFADLPVDLPAPDEDSAIHARHLYTLLIDEEQCGISRDSFLEKMRQYNIGAGVHYIGIHLHPYYAQEFGFSRDDFPNASWVSDCTVSLPLSPKLEDRDVEDVISAVKKAIN